MRSISTEEAKAQVVADIEARIAHRDANKPVDKDCLAIHEFGTAGLRSELEWAKVAKTPFLLWDDGDRVEVETFQ